MFRGGPLRGTQSICRWVGFEVVAALRGYLKTWRLWGEFGVLVNECRDDSRYFPVDTSQMSREGGIFAQAILSLRISL